MREYGVLEWLALLINNRRFNLDSPVAREASAYIRGNFLICLEPYDAIIGYRADDSYFSFAQDFLNNTISLEQLAYALRLGNLGEQFVLISEKSLRFLTFCQAIPASREEWLEKKERRDRLARNACFHSDRMNYRKGELYVTEILDKEVKADDSRLRSTIS